MKITKSIRFILFTVLLPLFSFAAEPEKELIKTDPKDAFLNLLVEKTKKYSEAGERAVEKAVDVAAVEAKPTMEEFLKWRAYKHIVMLIFFGAVVLILASASGWCFKKSVRDGSGQASIIFGCLGIVICAAYSFSTVQDHVLPLIQINVAPRIYLIEQVIGLIK